MELDRQQMPNQEHLVIMRSKLPIMNLSLSDLTLHKEHWSGVGAWGGGGMSSIWVSSNENDL